MDQFANPMANPPPSPGALPTYVQISEAIARRITAGQWLDGERLPPERTMAAEFGVAVGTLRKALSRLQGQQLIRSKHGSGNYINITPQAANIYSFFRLESLTGAGLPTAELLSVDRIPKPMDAPYFGPNSAAFRFRRLRFLDHQPAALEEIWLDGSVADHIAAEEISESLYHTYQTRFGLWIVRAEDHVTFAPTPPWSVDQFGLRPGETAGYVERIAWANTGAPLEFSRNWYDPSVSRYVARIK
ncbi:GntR family transcriptional regulator [Planktomarina temperata]|nr:GntR family transcriptional regulator [Planktomarina temperata]MDB2607518.1 GntR family transcriptional regulator [Planktomarina temperata]MDC1467915.1 GntR family transcriptional regulator [Planktomarina temperata]